MTEYIDRRNIRVYEEARNYGAITETTSWVAEWSGLAPGDVQLSMSRRGATSGAAVGSLLQAIEQQFETLEEHA